MNLISDYGAPPDERPWRGLLEGLIAGRMSAPQFETAFLDLWRDIQKISKPVPRVIDLWFFCEVDAYCADPSIRGPNDLDDAGLRLAAREALARLDRPLSEERH